MTQTIQDWENDRFAREAAAEIEAVEVAEPARTIVAEPDDVPTLVAVHGRITAGLGVQLLVEPVKGGRAFITLACNGKDETFEVRRDRALDAFAHPYCYGGTLKIR